MNRFPDRLPESWDDELEGGDENDALLLCFAFCAMLMSAGCVVVLAWLFAIQAGWL